MKTRIKSISLFATTGGSLLTVSVDARPNEMSETVQKAALGGYELEISKHRDKRSLDANAYYWVLLGKLAGVLGTSNGELHREMLGRYGVLAEREDGSIITFIHPSERDPAEIQPYSRAIRYGEIDGKAYTAYAVLKGSSKMDSGEFSRLLDGLISECKDQNIETLTPEEMERLRGYECVRMHM